MCGAAWRWWASLGRPRFVAAPMVDASERAFRLLVRELGVQLTFTPMLNARCMVEEPAYAERHFDADASEWPLVAQLAGRDPEPLVAAGRLCERGGVAAVDLNLGCPQEIARAGGYGAFLLEDEPRLAARCVAALAGALTVPVTAKVRLQPTRAATLDACRSLRDAGCSMLTVHGRSRLATARQQGHGAADWEAVSEVVSEIDLPVVANGGVGSLAEAERCLEATGAAAVMCAEGLLADPATFCGGVHPATCEALDEHALARRYLALCADGHAPRKGLAYVKGHVRRLLHNALALWPEHADELYVARDLAEVALVAERLAEAQRVGGGAGAHEHVARGAWYYRHRPEAAREAAAAAGIGRGGERLEHEEGSGVGRGLGGDPRQQAERRRRYLARSSASRRGRARRRLTAAAS